jgi:hypothetical protein
MALASLPASAWAQAAFFFCDPSVDECEDLTGFEGDPFDDDFDNFDDFDNGADDLDGRDFDTDQFDDPFDDDDFNDDFNGNDDFDDNSDFNFGNGDFDDFEGGGFQVGDDFNGGFDGNPVRIQRFDLTGNGCPTLGSTRVFLDGNGSQNRLRVQFGRNGGSFLQVQGSNDVSSCTTRARVLVNNPTTFTGSNSGPNGSFVVDGGGFGRGDSQFRLRRLVAGVRFVNPQVRGQLIVRSQSRVEGVNGRVARLQLPNSAQVRASDVRVTEGISVFTDGDVQLVNIIELESRGASGAVIRLEDLDLEFDVAPF